MTRMLVMGCRGQEDVGGGGAVADLGGASATVRLMTSPSPWTSGKQSTSSLPWVRPCSTSGMHCVAGEWPYV